LKHGLLWIAIALFVGGAVASTAWRQVAVRDRPVPNGIVSLAPNVTEIVFALGLQDRLVGVSTACDYPPGARELPKVGDFAAPDIELIYAFKPELVIATQLRDSEAKDAIRLTGARFLAVKQDSISDVLAAIETIGGAAGVPGVARAYTDRLRQRIARATVDVPAEKRPRVYVELSSQPLSTGGKGSFLDELIHLAGGRNIAHDLTKPWAIISPDDVVGKDPQIIIATQMDADDAGYLIEQRIGWSGVSAVKSGHVITDLNADLIRPGPRVAEGLEALTALFAKYRREEMQ